jgi:hypothetical protein
LSILKPTKAVNPLNEGIDPVNWLLPTDVTHPKAENSSSLEECIEKSRIFHEWSRAPGVYADSLYI